MKGSLIQASIDANKAEAAQDQAPPVIDTPVVKPASDQQKPVETTTVTPEVKTEPVAADTKVVPPELDSSKKPEGTKPPSNAGAIVNIDDAKTTNPVIEKPETNFSDVLSQQYNGRFKSQKDLDDFISEADKPRIKFANKIVAQLNQAITNGMSEQDFMRAYTLNPDTMTDLEAIKQRTKLENPGLSDSQIDRLLNKKYGADEEDTDSVQDAEILTITDGGSAKRFLKEYKDKFKVEMPDEAKLQAEAADREAGMQAQIDQHKQRIDQHIVSRGNDKYEIALSDKQKYTFNPSAEQLAEVRDQVADLSIFWDRYKGEDGTEKLYDDMFWAMNREPMMRSMAQAISNDGKKDILKDLTNPGDLDQTADPNAGGDTSWQEQASNVIFR